MIIWILSILDFFTLIALTFSHFGINHSVYFLLLSGIYLSSKFFIFKGVMSIPDLIAGIYILLVAIFNFSTNFYYLIFGWFLYKLISTVIR